MVKVQRSLKARALQYLAQREHSRLELRRKLLPHARADALAVPETGSQTGTAPERVEAVLDWLEAHAYLSQERFVESRVHARAARFGNLRIRQELKQHALMLPADTAQALRTSELERARAVRERKFGAVPADASGRARQARFLVGRGFSPDTIRQALRGGGTESDDD
ncbi:MAG TPA: recombination regulator RecX [Burkholderiaceae bacterium]|nr:recombination regulator RecX [Burkholderiaceae bacterium]